MPSYIKKQETYKKHKTKDNKNQSIEQKSLKDSTNAEDSAKQPDTYTKA